MSYTNSLPKECVLERIQAMMFQEKSSYSYESYFPTLSMEELEQQSQLNASWREKICQWSYNVVDHFDLPREVVAISLNLFDRYLATRDNQCNGNMALLASLTTLHIAIKIHSEKNIKISTLASLSRGQFGAKHIEQMEWQIMTALKWKLHPPTLFAFISNLLMLFPNDVHHSVRKELFEVAIYMAELSVCDTYFVKFPTSTVAMAAIINVLEDLPLHRLSLRSRDAFWSDISMHIHGFQPAKVELARERLKAMFVTASPSAGNNTMNTEPSVTTSPTSTTDNMQVDESTSIASSCADSSLFRAGSRAGSIDSKDRYRYSPSPTNHNMRRIAHVSSPMSGCRSRIAASPIVAGTQ
jgi:hypothetical protein